MGIFERNTTVPVLLLKLLNCLAVRTGIKSLNRRIFRDIRKYRSLNDDGQRRLTDYIDDLISGKRYMR